MNRKTTFLSYFVFLTFLTVIFAGELVGHEKVKQKNESKNSHEKWLGPQDKVDSPEYVRKRWASELELFEISIVILKGKNISIAESTNPLIVYTGGKLTHPKKLNIEKDRIYLYGKTTTKGEWTTALYDLKVRVTSKGPIKGAVVSLRDNQLPKGKFSDCFQVLIEVPDELKLEIGKVEFEIVSFKSK